MTISYSIESFLDPQGKNPEQIAADMAYAAVFAAVLEQRGDDIPLPQHALPLELPGDAAPAMDAVQEDTLKDLVPRSPVYDTAVMSQEELNRRHENLTNLRSRIETVTSPYIVLAQDLTPDSSLNERTMWTNRLKHESGKITWDYPGTIEGIHVTYRNQVRYKQGGDRNEADLWGVSILKSASEVFSTLAPSGANMYFTALDGISTLSAWNGHNDMLRAAFKSTYSQGFRLQKIDFDMRSELPVVTMSGTPANESALHTMQYVYDPGNDKFVLQDTHKYENGLTKLATKDYFELLADTVSLFPTMPIDQVIAK